MKKFISLFLTCVLIAGLAIITNAEENVGVGSYDFDVTGSYVANTAESGTVFSLDITWTDLSFTYYSEKPLEWDTESHTYIDSEPAHWEGQGTITITNHSNTDIYAVPTYAAKTGYEDAAMAFSTEKLLLASAAYSQKAVSDTITVTPTGSLPVMSEPAPIGSITITISECTDITVWDLYELKDDLDELDSAARESGANETYSDEYWNIQYSMADMAELSVYFEGGCENCNGLPCEDHREHFLSKYNNAKYNYIHFKELTGL